MLVVIDEFSRECLAIVVARRLRSDDVMACLADLFVRHGVPDHIRSDNGPEFVAKTVRGWLGRLDVRDCQKFRVWAMTMRAEETSHGTTKEACYC
jgi:transposase InsO family protein